MAGIFKAYDIRGVYGKQLNEDLAFRIGRAFATFTPCSKVVVGRDMRPHSKPLFDAFARGLAMQGADVVDLGLCSTPMSYFANGLLGADAGVTIGQIGAGAEISTTMNIGVDILAFSNSKLGLFGGAALEGAVLARRTDLNETYYETGAVPMEILYGGQYENPQSNALRALLAGR